jgi:hypothetical protein
VSLVSRLIQNLGLVQSPPLIPITPRDLFMQSEPSAVFDRASSTNPSLRESFIDTQHGHVLYGDHQVSGLPHEARDSEGVSDSDGQSHLSHMRSDFSIPAPSVKDRVTQHENAMAQSHWRHAELSFRVTPSSTLSRLSLDAFPNGRSPSSISLGIELSNHLDR